MIITRDGRYIEGIPCKNPKIIDIKRFLKSDIVHPLNKKMFFDEYYKNLNKFVDEKLELLPNYTKQERDSIFNKEDKYSKDYKKFRYKYPELSI